MSRSPALPLAQALNDRPAAPLCVGFSGGLDSAVLLHLLATDAGETQLRALHVHHGLQAGADEWARHCERICSELGVPLSVVHVEVTDNGEGLEAAARAARHEAFACALAPGDVLALAHHRDDQAETFLLRALRASGPEGLAAMRRWRPFGSGHLWRPLLAHGRDELLVYAKAHGLEWIEDPSNADARFDRNYLRRHVMPLLRQRWPHADAALARSAALCADATDALDSADALDLSGVATADPHCISRTRLQALPAIRRARVLRRWIAALELPPLPGHGVDRIEDELLAARPDAQATFCWHGAAVTAWRDVLHAGFVVPDLPPDWRAPWGGATPLPLPGGGSLELQGAAAFDSPVTVHARQGGERIVLPGRSHSHALKHVLQDLGVPPWERARLPLLSDADSQLLAAGDLIHSAVFDAWLRQRGARLRWRP
jgi:tRNA(Ile)-lysidine synthase